MALLKPAGGGREKPWHQDHAYFEIEPLDSIIGCWIAFDAATVENGCMQVVPGSHREGLLPHWKPESGAYQWEWQISPEQVEEDRVVAVPMPPGACLFFSSTLKHGTPPNLSPERRRALQIHFIVGDYKWTGGQPEPEFLVVR
jgi:ectoine hydroxylase-related dioxygenase (phytanoyl-CoA dioxygenase family)